MPGSQPRDTDWLHGVRGLAALIVVLGHASSFRMTVIPGVDLESTAKAGVWVFFMLSAYLLVGKIIRQLEAGGAILSVLRDYTVRRLLRIMPAYALVLSVVGFLQFGGVFDWPTVVRHLLLQEGWQHLWTIPVEMKFYAVVPVVALTLACLPAIGRLTLVTVMFLASVIAYLWAPYPRIAGNPTDLQNYLIFFTLGIVVLLVSPCVKLPSPALIAIGGVLVFIAAHPALLMRNLGLELYPAIECYPLSCIGGAVALLAASQSESIQAFLSLRGLVFAGNISFGLYLVHFFVFIEVARLTWLPARGPIAIAVSVTIAWAINRFVEQPSHLLGDHLIGQRTTFSDMLSGLVRRTKA